MMKVKKVLWGAGLVATLALGGCPSATAPSQGEEATPAEAQPSTQVQAISEDAIYGTWAADFEAFMATAEIREAERPLMEAMLRDSSMEFTFGADGSLHVESNAVGEVNSQNGQWSLTSIEGRTLTLEVTLQGQEGSRPATKTLRAIFDDDGALRIEDDGGQVIPMVPKR